MEIVCDDDERKQEGRICKSKFNFYYLKSIFKLKIIYFFYFLFKINYFNINYFDGLYQK